MTEFWEVAPVTPKRRSRNRLRKATDQAGETPDRNGNGDGRTEIDQSPTPSPVADYRQSGNTPIAGTDVSETVCVRCGRKLELTCTSCESPTEAQARQILEQIGRNFVEEAKTDRVKAFENYAAALMTNQAILVTSRIISLDSMGKMVQSVHQMLGPPKKKSEDMEAKPLEALAAWLNGQEIEGFPTTFVMNSTDPVDSDDAS